MPKIILVNESSTTLTVEDEPLPSFSVPMESGEKVELIFEGDSHSLLASIVLTENRVTIWDEIKGLPGFSINKKKLKDDTEEQ